MRRISRIWAAGILVSLLSLPVFGQQIARSGGAYDQQIQQEMTTLLHSNKKYNNVTSSVNDGIVDLTGTVNLYATKATLEHNARKKDHVAGVRDEITVAGVSVPDIQLRNDLARQLRYDRYGFGMVFNNLTIGVKNGVATVGGVVRMPVDKESALAIVTTTPGVKNVVDDIQVAPTSNFDDRIRFAELRAIYGHLPPSYRNDPERPVRIVVENGNVALYGVVDSNVDRSVAVSEARSVPGVFSVQDHIIISKG